MKKSISILVLLVLVAAGAFAQMSVGGGLLYDYSGNNGVKASFLGSDFYMGTTNSSFGAFGFIDFDYVEINMSIARGSIKLLYEVPGTSNDADFGTAIQLGLSVLGKYPIDLGSITLFPLLGLNYNMVLSLEDKDGRKYSDAGDWSQFGLQAGLGLNFSFSDSLYLLAEALFQLRFPSKFQDDLKTEIENDTGGIITFDKTLGMGPVIKVGVGFKL